MQTILITGGTGALGGHVARWLAEAGAEHLAADARQLALQCGKAQGAGQQAAGTTGDNPWNASANASGNRDTHHAERVRKWKSMNLSSPHAQIAGEKNPNGLTDFLDFYGILPEPIPDNTELENTDGNNLEESILQWLAEGQVMPTPTARDWKGAPSLENLKKRGKIPQKNSLPDFFARTGKSFQLNPLFVAEMMGFPPDWTVSPFLGEDRHPLKDTGTLSSPR